MAIASWRRSHRSYEHRVTYERTLGTTLDLRIVGENFAACQSAEARVLSEIDRLEMIFSRYRDDSELARWEKNSEMELSTELFHLLEEGERWRNASGGAFHPAVEALTTLWKSGDPDKSEIEAVVNWLQKPLWAADRETRRVTRLSELPTNLNSVAKGFIADRACEAGFSGAITELTVNLGGDIAHRGERAITVQIRDPFQVFDNGTPLFHIRLQNGGLATSGNYYRGFETSRGFKSHVLDPRTGEPVDEVVSASVIASSAMLADILTTVFSVLSVAQSIAFSKRLDDIGLLIIDRDGNQTTNDVWDALAT